MGFFGKKKVEDIPKDEELTLKTELELEIEKLQKEINEKQEKLDEITQRIGTVKEEYDSTVGSLMLVKKELNQKKMELDIIQREYRETREKAKKSELIKDTKSVEKFNKTEGDHSKIKEELDEFTKKYDEIKEQIEQEQSTLHNIKKQQLEVGKELDEANSRLYNAKEELNKKDIFEDTSILTPSEKKFIGIDNENQKSSAGIIEAASAVVGSLKSKLNITLKELETVQTLLEKEREEHEKTKKDLKNLKQTAKSLDES
ncbi:MAG: DNA repair protein [Candidatus Nitrosopumilus sp. Bin_571-38]|jgi:chromosome segregation ATPase